MRAALCPGAAGKMTLLCNTNTNSILKKSLQSCSLFFQVEQEIATVSLERMISQEVETWLCLGHEKGKKKGKEL